MILDFSSISARARNTRQSGGRREVVLAVGVAAAFGVLGLLVLSLATRVELQDQAEWALIIAPILALSVLGAVLAELSRRYAEAEAAVKSGEALYRLLAENTSDMIVLGGLETTRRYVSPACRDLLGYEPYELIGTRPVDGVHPDDAGAYRAILERLTSGKDERVTSSQRYRRKDGSWVWTEVTFRLVRDEWGHPTAYVASVRGITARHMLEEQLREQARTDVLTGLYNRRSLEERLEEERRRAQRSGAPLALLCLDIDFFKQFNDHFGHAAGDECLKQVAEIIRQERRASDFAARLGGEEFVLILPETTAEGAVAVAEVIRNKLSAAQIAHPRSRYAVVTASIGVAASSPVDLGDATSLLKAADMAMYQAKRSGRNRVVLGMQTGSAIASPAPTTLVA